MDETVATPFCSCGDVNEIACINNWMQFADLAKHYVRSADALVNAALNDHMLLDVHVQPLCFLYRHGLELILKDLAWKSHYLTTGTKIFAQKKCGELGKHQLTRLWRFANEAARTVLGSDWPLDSNGSREVESLLANIEEHDPGSYSFRYPIGIGKKQGKTHPKLENVNIRAVRDSVNDIFARIEAILDLIDYCIEECGNA